MCWSASKAVRSPYLVRSDADCDEFIAEGDLTLAQTGTYNLEFAGPYDSVRRTTGTEGRYTGAFSQDGGRLGPSLRCPALMDATNPTLEFPC